ncbi:electron transport complex subunit RsxG [Vibrio sp. SS-MA-C1-2]|uniref:electron transport complex subunit RsxG n=1 Tax=Vibrio sp. SS-MA-C1-2 TaxID=2908646 RepID=UPI001F4114F9|nr:electron transport complex subunit RsxG [Vibrio sp. SS-MA-C1-2]UJF18710.1 electron transport complex subunit RsxG [Vibrio sp. SS-MA-C1-2]
MYKAMGKNGIILAIFALLATALVAVTNAVTKDTIAKQQELQLLRTLNQIIPSTSYDNDLYASCTLVTAPEALGTTNAMPVYLATKEGKPVGAAIETIAPDGYSGAIHSIIAVDYNGVVTGVRVLEQHETPGLGDKISIRVTNWVDDFLGKSVTPENESRWAVRKDGGDFDQFTGATITPRAVVKSVKRTVTYYNQNRDQLFNQPFNCREK